MLAASNAWKKLFEMQTPLVKEQKMNRGFTLIELLVVIAIIAVLAGLLFPAGQSALDSTKKTAAKNQCVQIATAITAYESEYGRLPAFSSTNFDASAVTMLCTTNDAVNNPRGIIFLESTSWKNGKGGTNGSGFCTPFSSVTPYSVALDTNYANNLSNIPVQSSPGGSLTTTNLTQRIAVWTIWTNRSRPTIINSWD